MLSHLNRAYAKLAPRKLAPYLLLLNSHEADLFGQKARQTHMNYGVLALHLDSGQERHFCPYTLYISQGVGMNEKEGTDNLVFLGYK